MKKSIAILGLLGILLISCDPGKDISGLDVPSVVINELKTQFPKLTDLEWEITGTTYTAEFEDATIDHIALIDQNGRILKYKFEIPLMELPENIKQNLRKKYPNKVAEDAHVLKIDGDTFYEVEFESWLTDTYKVFSASGKENKNIAHWD